MGLFGSDTVVTTTTSSKAQDQRTLAEAGGVAAQSVGGDLILQSTPEGAIEGIVAATEGALDVAALATGRIADATAHSLDIVAATRGSQPINPVFVILAIGAAFWLAKRGGVI